MEKHDWIAQIKAHGLGGALDVLLDVLEPFSPLGAQILWIIQPVSGLWGRQETIGQIAERLEEPDGIGRLRRYIEENYSQTDKDGEENALH